MRHLITQKRKTDTRFTYKGEGVIPS